jgi:hypothetical protein
MWFVLDYYVSSNGIKGVNKIKKKTRGNCHTASLREEGYYP